VDQIPIPESEIVPFDTVAPGVVGLGILFVNVYGVHGESGWTLIDAGLYGSAGRIRAWARNYFRDEPPVAIVLTHAHFDHVGALDELVREWRTPVYAHEQEIPYVTGARAYPPADPSVGGGLMARMSSLYPRQPITFTGDVRPLPLDGTIPTLPSWNVIHTPGHTAGHVSLYRSIDGALIAGDAFCTTTPESFFSALITQSPVMHGPPAYFTTDWDAARESVRKLSRLNPTLIATGHGKPMAGGETTSALRELAARFDDVARPQAGRYVRAPVRG
jgi:glyoxylase-like metal-dependent hydrolase (beta-lactamase superfamily II)